MSTTGMGVAAASFKLWRNLRDLAAMRVHQRGVALDLGVPAGPWPLLTTNGRASRRSGSAQIAQLTSPRWPNAAGAIPARMGPKRPCCRAGSRCPRAGLGMSPVLPRPGSQSATLPRWRRAVFRGLRNPDGRRVSPPRPPYFGEPGHLGGQFEMVLDDGITVLRKSRCVGDRDDLVGRTADRPCGRARRRSERAATACRWHGLGPQSAGYPVLPQPKLVQRKFQRVEESRWPEISRTSFYPVAA